MKRCARCDQDTGKAKGRTSSGGWQVFWYCFGCQRREGSESIPHLLVPDIDALPVVWDNIAQQQRGPCATCFKEAQLQYHHWAPKHLFGEEAEYWPGSMVCQTCHDRWHAVATPLMSMPEAIGIIIAALPPEHPISRALKQAEMRRLKNLERKISPEQDAAWRARKAKARREDAA